MNEHLNWSFLAYLAGIWLYFSYSVHCLIAFSFLISSCFLWYWGRKKQLLSWGSILIFFLGLGLLIPEVKSHLIAHPVLEKSLYQTSITGTVQESTHLPEKQIVVLTDIKWHLPQISLPHKVQLFYNEPTPSFSEGDAVKVTATLFPPQGQQAPFSKGTERTLWFKEIGATGYITKAEITHINPKLAFSFSQLRTFINKHIFQILPTSQAQIAAALITGEQKLISPEIFQIYRRSGIAHVLSVSGFHMALLATFLFFCIRGFCALFPKIALYCNSKKIAALCALIGTGFYLGVSGFQIPATRAFGMIFLVFLGILTDRNVFSLRSFQI